MSVDSGAPVRRGGELWREAGGSGDPTLLLLHGLGGTGGVWSPVLDRVRADWPGSWVVCDLPGHGHSGWPAVASFGRYAAEVADLVGDSRDVVAVGHSLGGVVALLLGTGWFGVPVSRVVAIGVKVHWTDEELEVSRRRATKPVAYFPDEDSALDRLVKVAGLPNGTPAGSDLVRRGLVSDPEGFRLSMDPAASPTARATESPARMVSAAIGASRAEVRMVCGSEDPGVTIEQLRALDPDAIELPGAGHSPHVERPDEVYRIIRGL
ncbi:alpha/beta fold hydrolase [Rugosimonospora africana]|uniref:Alpha/beta hydrolase n=1 Tax=Rugosimonospora africana TaxID=556532 RepID=A0A8J3QPL1_9ACTN|nr:alpha/beta hydrolase [Rugosimonospora africana]GIH13907.1 alpha/beta hydrolase [Rugosimonospora africana]